MASEHGGMSTQHEGMLPVESMDVSQRDDVHKLHGGAVGILGVLFLTVTGAAPISAMLFNTPLSVGYGNGIGTPAGFAFATVILTIFSVGYVAMARKVTAAGGFYSFISHGLGRELGMASGLAMVVAYSVFEASLCGGFAYFASLKAQQYGYNIEWYWLALFMVALIGVLAYFDIHISARLLGIALISEVVFLLIFDVLIFGQGGENIQTAALNPVNAFKNMPGSAAVETRSPQGRGRWACSSPSGRGSASRWRRTTARSQRTPRRSCRWPCTSRSSGSGSSTSSRPGRRSRATPPTEAAVEPGREQRFRVLPRPGQAVRERVPPERPELADHHRLVRLRDGLPQHDRAVSLLARS